MRRRGADREEKRVTRGERHDPTTTEPEQLDLNDANQRRPLADVRDPGGRKASRIRCRMSVVRSIDVTEQVKFCRSGAGSTSISQIKT